MSIKYISIGVVALFLLISCNNQQKVNLDRYSFYVSNDFEVMRKANQENVMLTLSNRKGGALMIQNNINILLSLLLSNSEPTDVLRHMHDFKFISYVNELNGYKLSTVEYRVLENVEYTTQSFLYEEEGKEVYSIVSIVKLDSDYYPLYFMNILPNRTENNRLLEDIFISLNDNMK